MEAEQSPPSTSSESWSQAGRGKDQLSLRAAAEITALPTLILAWDSDRRPLASRIVREPVAVD